jgi:hypothetical protein
MTSEAASARARVARLREAKRGWNAHPRGRERAKIKRDVGNKLI